jgi:protein-tyrosine-phosphatase
MAMSQAEVLAQMSADLGEEVALLDPAGRNIADPFGGDAAAYRHARRRLETSMAARLAGWQAAGVGGPR